MRPGAVREISFTDNTYAERMGWREIVVSGEAVSLDGNLLNYTRSLSKRLTEYPNDRLNSPLNQRDVTFNVVSGELVTQSTEPTAGQPASAITAQRSDTFTELITLETLNLPTVLFALAVALMASQFIFPEQVFPWISFLSGLLVVGIGLNLCLTRLRQARQARQRQMAPLAEGYHEHNGVAHSHDGGHEHSHLPDEVKAALKWEGWLGEMERRLRTWIYSFGSCTAERSTSRD